ncbi:prostaglandin E synthase 2-like [Tubulanus polymorphus]|uniref:prostaglandin E synthase 2-like n=1 Tax=Tubulanus polymorphus TaxID=672921 RepID=UPI003DA66B3B
MISKRIFASLPFLRNPSNWKVFGLNSQIKRNVSQSKIPKISINSKVSRICAMMGGGLALGYGVVYCSKKVIQSKSTLLADSIERPKFKISREIYNEADQSGLKITLYQYQTCPFCCKVRAFLDYHGLSYNVIEVNSVKQTQIKWSTYRKVPIVVLEGIGQNGYIQLNDSSVIISLLSTHLRHPDVSIEKLVTYYPTLKSMNDKGKTVFEHPNKYFVMNFSDLPEEKMKAGKKERIWREWADSVLVHMLSPNIYRTPIEALQAFNHFDEVGNWEQNFSKFERLVVIYVGAAAMFIIGKVLKRRYDLKDDVRLSLYEACNHWTRELKKQSTKFMGGNLPNLADLAVYGVLSSIEGCKAFEDTLENTDISQWYYDTKNIAVNRTKCPTVGLLDKKHA